MSFDTTLYRNTDWLIVSNINTFKSVRCILISPEASVSEKFCRMRGALCAFLMGHNIYQNTPTGIPGEPKEDENKGIPWLKEWLTFNHYSIHRLA